MGLARHSLPSSIALLPPTRHRVVLLFRQWLGKERASALWLSPWRPSTNRQVPWDALLSMFPVCLPFGCAPRRLIDRSVQFIRSRHFEVISTASLIYSVCVCVCVCSPLAPSPIARLSVYVSFQSAPLFSLQSSTMPPSLFLGAFSTNSSIRTWALSLPLFHSDCLPSVGVGRQASIDSLACISGLEKIFFLPLYQVLPALSSVWPPLPSSILSGSLCI